ncbi:ATP-binding protein [Roseimicrobium sp. ORNL1]|uniref:ATP-binding protein n=1 Tax=Roseimicrobium sp. ORNL1 TaxID=2711231 RepID=UPI0013E1A0A4|nr:ATP-binding protein [Roseimicrobium sp. ORNL1]QIF00803.1 response regulator [Roseimicrobium sp. ORNL1]
MRLRQQTPKSILVLFAGAMILSAFVLSVIVWLRLNDSVGRRMEVRTVAIEWEKLVSMLKDAETGQRGYLITGDETYLQPFQSAAAALPAQYQKLTELENTQDDEYGETELLAFQRLTDRRMDELREAITVRRREGAEAAATLVKQGKGMEIMNDIRLKAGERVAELDARMDLYNRVMEGDLRWGFYSVAGTSLASFLAGLLAWRLLRESEQQARREERLAMEKRRAEQADREKSIFLATMSHEIRTPMNAILGFGELLAGEAGTDKERRYAQSIVRSGHSLLQIINDILDLSKIEAGMMEINPSATDVRELAAFVQQLFNTQAHAKGVEMRVEVSEDVPHSLLLDSTRLRQVLINLAGNAFKFTEQGSVTVRFSGHREEDVRPMYRLVVEVIDTGVGIPPERLTEIFKPFVQAKVKRDAENHGTGLGLAIVRRLADLMRGTISVQSEMGKGSIFRLDLPRVEVSARLPQAAVPEEPAVDFNDLIPAEILVVDDNPVNRELVRGFFENTHHQLREASDGREALQALRERRPHIVLMDIRMPVMDGREALRALRESKDLDPLPVIAVTASSLVGEEASLRQSFDGFVRKPFSRAQLFRELAQFLPRRKRESESETEMREVQPTPAWKQLIEKLHDMEASTWPAVRDGMVISEVSAFAGRLRDLALKYACPPLELYASDLISQCQSFSSGGLDKLMESFPRVIAKIEERLAAT